MGASTERIALEITATAEVSALQRTRAEVSAAGQSAKEANDKVAVSANAMSEALKRNGGDLAKAAAELAKLAGAEKQKAQQDDATIQRMGRLEAAARKEDETRDAAFQREMRRRAALEASAYREDAARRAGVPAPTSTFPSGYTSPGGAGITGVPAAVARTNAEVDKLNPKLRTAANSLAIVSQAAVTGTGSMAGLAVATGNVVQGLVSLETSAKAVQRATIIGIIVTLGATIYGIYEKITGQAKTFTNEIEAANAEAASLAKTLGGDELGAKLENINRKTDAQVKKLQDVNFVTKLLGINEAERLRLIDAINKGRNLEIEAAKRAAAEQQRSRSVALFDREQALASEAQLAELETVKIGTFKAQQHALELQFATRRDEITQLAEQRDQYGNIKALTDDQRKNIETMRAQLETILGLNKLRIAQDRERAQIEAQIQAAAGSDSLSARFEARLRQIQIERDAEIKATEDVKSADATAENKKRQLYRETRRIANENARSLLDVLRSSHTAELKAIGTFGENVRRIIIGAESARAAVRAAVEGAEAIASLASGDFRGAALHGAAALELAKAATLGAQEALGGGRTASGGGGGGGGGTFEPRQQGASGSAQVVNLYTVDPYSGEAIRQAAYHLDRGGVLKKPIYLPPTTGFAGVG